jgi:hypothetical protein
MTIRFHFSCLVPLILSFTTPSPFSSKEPHLKKCPAFLVAFWYPNMDTFWGGDLGTQKASVSMTTEECWTEGKERKGKERKGKERKGKERKGKEGEAQHGTARHGTARHGTARHGTARHGTARKDIK